MFSSISFWPYFSRIGLKNSSPHDGENVVMPSKSISTISFSVILSRVGLNALKDSCPNCRDIRTVPNFFREIFIVFY